MNPYDILFETSQKIKRNSCAIFTKDQEKELYPELSILEKNWELIRDESIHAQSISYGDIDEVQLKIHVNPEKKWLVHYLILMREETKNAEHSKNTMHLLRDLISKGIDVRNAFYSILPPDAQLLPHVGPMSSVLRYHLGLQCPSNNCWLQLENKQIKWENGKGFLWNDMFLHSAHNKSEETRIILFLDIGRKDLTKEETNLDEKNIKKLCDTEMFKEYIKKLDVSL